MQQVPILKKNSIPQTKFNKRRSEILEQVYTFFQFLLTNFATIFLRNYLQILPNLFLKKIENQGKNSRKNYPIKGEPQKTSQNLRSGRDSAQVMLK